MKKLLPEAIVVCAIIMAVSYGFAQTWWQTGAPYARCNCIALSADGRIIIALGSGVPAAISTNSGANWTTNGPTYGVSGASSADGTKFLTASIEGLFMSTNSGNTWNEIISSLSGLSSCTLSADGNRLAACANGLIYTSTNSGKTWHNYDAPIADMLLASSADGTKFIAGGYDDNVYVSTNSGRTWAESIVSTNTWRAVASSADGTCLAATGDGGTYISTNSGNSWTSLSITGFGVASSAGGSKLIIADDLGNIHISTNFGMSWASTNIPKMYWTAVAASVDGSEFVAGSDTIWICQTTPHPQLSLAPSVTNVICSWLVPSTNFVLQQSSTLTATNWKDVTNPPVLNLTNLQNEVTLPLTGPSGFYRLTTP
jgi:hypothetical protein